MTPDFQLIAPPAARLAALYAVRRSMSVTLPPPPAPPGDDDDTKPALRVLH